MNDDYLQDLMVRMAHESTAIEGNTLTEDETRSILVTEYIPRPVSLQEVQEVQNYKKLMPYLLKHKDEDITFQAIQDVNRILMENLDNRTGNTISGMRYLTIPPNRMDGEIKKWTNDLSWRLEYSTTPEEKAKTIMASHIQFQKLNPFANGTGRTARALVVWSCLKEHLTPVIIQAQEKEKYFHSLIKNDLEELMILAAESKMKEEERLQDLDDEYKIDKNLLKTLSDELEETHGTFYQDEQLESEYSQNRAFLNIVKTKRDQEQVRLRVRDYTEHCKSKSRSAAPDRNRENELDTGRERF